MRVTLEAADRRAVHCPLVQWRRIRFGGTISPAPACRPGPDLQLLPAFSGPLFVESENLMRKEANMSIIRNNCFGVRSYVELLTCLQIAKDAKSLPK